MEIKTKKRDVNIELLRIVAMFMVITLHCIQHGLLLNNRNISIVNSILIQFLNFFALTANAIFIIITGYYNIEKKFNINKILTLWGKTLLYSIIIFAFCTILDMKTYVYNSFFPIMSGQYWFISSYISLCFLMPIINIMLNKLNKKQFKYLLIVLLVLYGGIRTLFNPSGIFNGGLVQMLVIYMLGAYIKKCVTIQPKKQYFIKYLLITVICTIIYILLNILSIIVVKEIEILNIIKISMSHFNEFTNILLVAMTVLMFMKFKTVNIKSNIITKIITFISPSVFSIYIIHENVNYRDTLWPQLGMMDYANSWLMIPYMILLIISVFTVCLLIDLLRRGIYNVLKKIPWIKICIDKSNEKIQTINNKINNYLS